MLTFYKHTHVGARQTANVLTITNFLPPFVSPSLVGLRGETNGLQDDFKSRSCAHLPSPYLSVIFD
ncbi:MAG: hypothetical protein AAF614_11365 [Chloroflexota bacterium]